MKLRQRLKRLEEAAGKRDTHTCGPIVLVDFDEKEPPPLPPCKACEREGGQRIRLVVFRRAPPREVVTE
jgi:hypothetical protein